MSIVYLTLNQFLDFASFEFYCVIRISVLRILKSSKYANPDAKKGHSDTDTPAAVRPAGRTQPPRPAGVHASAAHSRRSGQRQTPVPCTGPIQSLVICSPRAPARSHTGSGILALTRGGLGSAGSWPCTSTGRISCKNNNQKSICREQGGGTPESARRGTGGAAREIRSPQVNTLHRKPGARWSLRDQRTDTLRVRTVDSCWPRALGGQQLLAVTGRSALNSHAVRVLSFRPRRSAPLLRAHTAYAGPELSQPASTPVLSAGRLLPAMSTQQNLFCIVLGAVPDRSLTLRGAALVTCKSACRSESRNVRDHLTRSR